MKRPVCAAVSCAAALLLSACATAALPRKPEAPPPSPPQEAPVEETSGGASGSGLPEPAGFTRSGVVPTEGLRFIPASLPTLRIPPGVGRVDAAMPEAEKSLLQEAFQTAYLDGLLQDLPLDGVLGGDLTHRWPPGHPVNWAQNWRHTGPEKANSWGIPSLVLALRGSGEETDLVYGPILDFYGKSKGVGGANGAAGYGAPQGNVFFHEGGIVQAFDYGIILIVPSEEYSGSPDAASFIPWERLAGEETGGYTLPPDSPAVEKAFRAAWNREAVRCRVNLRLPPRADGPPVYFPWEGEAAGIYLQFFDNARTVFAVLDAPELPGTARVIRAPFLDALLASTPLPGAEELTPRSLPYDGFTGALLEGFARYGLPLTDALPRAGEDSWVEAQRFSLGWIERRIERDNSD